MRAALALIAAPALISCASFCSPEPEISAPCPAVLMAEAWINRMPGPKSQNLVVSVSLDTLDIWTLVTLGDVRGPVLQLALRAGGGGNPGTAAWRSASARPDRVEILCNGVLHYTITEVEAVY